MFEEKEVEAIPYKNNNLLIEPFGPYGFYRIRIELGETPGALKDQQFTDRSFARQEITNYIQKNSKEKVK